MSTIEALGISFTIEAEYQYSGFDSDEWEDELEEEAVNIGKRGLLGKASVNRKKKIYQTTHASVRKVSRDKCVSTPSRQKRKKVDHAALRRILRAVHKPDKYYPRYTVALDTCVVDVTQVISVSTACEITHENKHDGHLSHHGLCE